MGHIQRWCCGLRGQALGLFLYPAYVQMWLWIGSDPFSFSRSKQKKQPILSLSAALLTHFGSDNLVGDRVRGSPSTPVCPQNRAYGSVHGSSCHPNPLIDRKPMGICPLLIRSDLLSHLIYKPWHRICLCHSKFA